MPLFRYQNGTLHFIQLWISLYPIIKLLNYLLVLEHQKPQVALFIKLTLYKIASDVMFLILLSS